MKHSVISIVFTALFLLFTGAANAIEPIKYGGNCAWTLLEKKLQRTKCEVTWLSPEKLKFCFKNEDAMYEFLKDTWGNTRKANDNYASFINQNSRKEEKKVEKKKKRRP